MEEQKAKRSISATLLIIIVLILLFLVIIYLAKMQKNDKVNRNMLCQQSIIRVLPIG